MAKSYKPAPKAKAPARARIQDADFATPKITRRQAMASAKRRFPVKAPR